MSSVGARIDYIDIAKGIGILLIIGLHSSFHVDWMVSFEMPLFFILSGLFFSTKLGFGRFLIKKINTILIPYLFFEAPKFIYDAYYAYAHSGTLVDSMINSSIPTTTWFLLCLFEIQVGCYFLVRYIKAKYLLALCALVLSVAGYGLSVAKVENVLFLNSAVTGSAYFLFGYVIKDKLSGWLNAKKTVTCVLIGCASIGVCYMSWLVYEPYIFYRANSLGNSYMTVIITALSGALGIVAISKAISNNRILEFYGRNSLIILGVHLYIIVIMNRLPIHISTVAEFLIVSLLMVPTIWLLRKYCSRLCGIRPLLSWSEYDGIALKKDYNV